jgi:hypothetical protein
MVKFKENLWCDKELGYKRKLRYYEVVNYNLDDQKYLFISTSIKKTINIVKIRTNSHKIHTGTCIEQFPKHHGIK